MTSPLRCLLPTLGALLLIPAMTTAEEPYQVAPEVEPEVRTALAAAWERLPPAHRQRLGDLHLTVARAPALPVPADAPLAARLMGRAAHAWFNTRGDVLTVANAALRGPRWEGPAPDPAELRPLLAALAPALQVEVPADADAAALRPAWTAFVNRCREVLGGEWPSAQTSPLGDPRVLQRFLEAGVVASLGGELPGLEALLVHELAHALQLGPKGNTHRVAGWAALSGWTEVGSGDPADGYVGGSWANEDPTVLIQILLGCPRGPGATFAPGEGARFPTPYARFDPREDFAECYRLALTDPATLARLAPEKLLAINALGWQAEVESPPLFADANRPWLRELTSGVERLLGRSAPAPRSQDALAILNAAKPLLEALELPGGERPPFALPADLPQPIRKTWGESELGVVLSDRTLYLAGERVARDLEALCKRFASHVEFDHGIALMRREIEPNASYAKVMEERTGDAALAFLRLVVAGEPAERLEAWLPEADGAQQALIFAALLAKKPDDPDLAKAFGQLPSLSPYASALVASLLIEPELEAEAQETPSTPVRLALYQLEAHSATTWVPATRARALALFARSSAEPERAQRAGEARAEVAKVVLPALRAKVEADVERLLTPKSQ